MLEHARLQQHRHLVERLAEPHDVEHDLGAVVGGVVGDLHAAHLLDALAGARERERDEVVDESGVDAGDEDTRITLLGSVFHAVDVLVGHHAPRVLQQPGRRPDDVDAGGQDAHDVGHRVGQPGVAHRAVDDAVGLGGQQGVEVVDGRDAGDGTVVQADAAQLAGVLAHLLRR